MSLWEWAYRILEIEERIREEVKREIEQLGIHERTQTIDIPSVTVDGEYKVLDVKGWGKLIVLLITSDSKDYELSVLAAGKDVFRRRSWDHFATIALGNPDIDAQDRTAVEGYYFLRIANVSFEGSLLAVIHTRSPVNFSIFAKYYVYEKVRL